MRGSPDTIEGWLVVYEGLIFSTAELVVENGAEIELDDARAILREKVWKALRAFDERKWTKKATAHIGGGKCGCSRCRYVFMCVRDKRKDLEMLRRRYDSYISDLTSAGAGDGDRSDRFELEHGLVAARDDVYAGVEDEGVVIPSTLNDRERRVVCLLYASYRQTEIALRLGLQRREVEQAVRSIREKMGDWKPSTEDAGEVISLDALREAA